MNQEFNEKNFAKFLEENPLYYSEEFSCNSTDVINEFRVNQLDSLCDQCEQIRTFSNEDSGKSLLAKSMIAGNAAIPNILNNTETLNFKCLSCRQQRKTFLVNISLNVDKVTFVKVGEFPRKNMAVDPELKKFLKNDKDNYIKAEVCLSNGYGVGAFAYFRRIIESNIYQLLDNIATDSESDQSIIDAIAELKSTSPMSDRIAIAKKALPGYLSPNGLNPLGQIYKQLSEGVHALPDDECLKRAKIIKSCLVFLVGELAQRKRNIDQFTANIGQLSSL